MILFWQLNETPDLLIRYWYVGLGLKSRLIISNASCRFVPLFYTKELAECLLTGDEVYGDY